MGRNKLAELSTITLAQYGPSVPASRPLNAHVNVEEVLKAELTAEGHIIVSGECDHAVLTSRSGSVFLMYGSLKDTKVRAGMNAYVKFATFSDIRADQDVIVEQSIVRSEVRAGRKIISEADAGKIIGGKAVAGSDIRIHTIGSETQVSTHIELTDPSCSITAKYVYGGVTVMIGKHVYTLQKDITLPGLKRIFVHENALCTARLYLAETPDGKKCLKQGEIWLLNSY